MYRMAWGGVSEPKQGEEGIHRALAACMVESDNVYIWGGCLGMGFQ